MRLATRRSRRRYGKTRDCKIILDVIGKLYNRKTVAATVTATAAAASE